MKTKFALIIFLVVFAGIAVYAQDARITELTGVVEIKETGGQWQPAAVGAAIAKATVISTGIKSTAVVAVGSSTVSVSPLTVLSLEELLQQSDTEEAVLFLRTGRVKADVTPPSGMKTEFTVRSPTTTASVQGTSFTFGGGKLYVHSGKVAFANSKGQKVYVNKNQHSYANGSHDNKLSLPFEAESASTRPTFNDLDNTGSKGNKPQKQMPQVSIDINWD